MLQREDMLELTRRMTIKRTCFTRVAGCYLDEEGYVDGSFNTNFLKLKPVDKEKMLAVAKTIPFSDTNRELTEKDFPGDSPVSHKMWQLLTAINASGLKNDAMLDTLYDLISENYHPGFPYAVYVFSGTYDIPLKSTDHREIGESEEVYDFVICAICPVSGDYEAGQPLSGFLFPSFADRSSDNRHLAFYTAERGKTAAINLSWVLGLS